MRQNSWETEWTALVADHSTAIEEFRVAVDRLSDRRWMLPLAPGKWTAAEVTSHVTEAYRVVQAELAGKAGMRPLGSRLQRFILRHTVLPRLLAGRPFPPGVRAPRETRPREIIPVPAVALTALEEIAHELADQLTSRAAINRACLTHAYFGLLSPRQGIRLLTAHTRHHARQLADASPA